MYVEREEDHFTLTCKPRNSAKEQRTTIKIPPGSPLALRQQDKRFGSSASDVEPIAWTNAHQLLIASWTWPSSIALTFYELDTDKPAKPVRWWNVKTPQNRYAGKIILSPKGDRLAWQAASDWENAGNNPASADLQTGGRCCGVTQCSIHNHTGSSRCIQAAWMAAIGAIWAALSSMAIL